jgi:L-amino acid N-acyltransferase YncA
VADDTRIPMQGMLTRRAVQDDLPALVGIHNHYVVHGHATFQTVLQTVESRQPSSGGSPQRQAA